MCITSILTATIGPAGPAGRVQPARIPVRANYGAQQPSAAARRVSDPRWRDSRGEPRAISNDVKGNGASDGTRTRDLRRDRPAL